LPPEQRDAAVKTYGEMLLKGGDYSCNGNFGSLAVAAAEDARRASRSEKLARMMQKVATDAGIYFPAT
jgi:hypothetical protein